MARNDSRSSSSGSSSSNEDPTKYRDLSVDGLAGHEPRVAEWEATEAGQQFIKDSKDQVKQDKADAEATRKEAESTTPDASNNYSESKN